MEKRIGYFALAGLAIGASVGLVMAAPSGRALWGLGVGAPIGVFLGWFVAAAVEQLNRDKANSGSQ